MVQFFYEPSDSEMPHWCIALVPDDEATTVTFLQGTDTQNLTFAQAEEKALQLNKKFEE